MFSPASGGMLGLPTSDTHLNVKWSSGDIYFSMTRRGNGLSCHFSSSKESLRRIKPAIEEFCQWAFSLFKWCKMILAVIERPSVARLVRKCGFEEAGEINNKQVYMRLR